MHSRAIQCKQAAYTSVLTKVGNGCHVDVRAWAENTANAWLPIQTYGKTSKGHNLVWIKIPLRQISFRPHVKIIPPSAPNPRYLIII